MQKTQIKLIFSIFGDYFDSQEFGKLVNLIPSNTWIKGDSLTNRKGLIRKETAWEYSIGFYQTLFLEEILDVFIQKFSPHSEVIVNYIKQYNLETKIDIIVEIVNDEKPSLFFEKAFLNLLSKMKGEIDIDLYISNNNTPVSSDLQSVL
jgi:hypothetical protein